MNTNQIANRLVELCRKGQWETAQKELFANDAVSIEPYASPAFEKETKGLSAILEKGQKWGSMVDKVNGLDVSEPIVANNAFACTMHMDVTMKNKEHMDMTELCTYQVKDGKIVEEHFYV
jgi:ketosteroid isomerase-like protein